MERRQTDWGVWRKIKRDRRQALDELIAGAAIGGLFIAVALALLRGRYDAIAIAALGLWLLTGLP